MIKQDLFDARPQVKRSKRINTLPVNPETEVESNSGLSLGRFPSWLHRKLPKGKELQKTKDILSKQRLNTVCEEAKCPNLMECWSRKTATFLIMGKECTRSCSFCDIDFSKTPNPLDPKEPENVAESIKGLGLKHIVLTMVARDDLSDGGALHLVKVIDAIRSASASATIEVLTSDFMGNEKALDLVLAAKPEIFNHNIETVERLTPRVRHTAKYQRTLDVLRYAKEKGHNQYVKSGIMVGLGESHEEVEKTIKDLHDIGCDIVTIGQYLQANRNKLRVKSFVTPEQFKVYEEYGYSIGIKQMYSGPFVRSSYNAGELLEKMPKRR
jgi:lipoic acid synthetase